MQGRRLVRAGTPAIRAIAPGLAAALGTFGGVPSDAGAILIGDSPSIGDTPSTALPVSTPTNEIDIPAFGSSQFFSFSLPADTHNLHIGLTLSGNDPDPNVYFLLTTAGGLSQQIAIPLITIAAPGADTISGGSTIIAQPTGSATFLGGGSASAATIMGGPGNFTIGAGAYLSFADLSIPSVGAETISVGAETISGGAETISGGAGSFPVTTNTQSTIVGAGNSTIVGFGGSETIIGTGGSPTISAGGGAGAGPATISGGAGLPATILGGSMLNAFFNSGPSANDVIVGIDLLSFDTHFSGGVISFSEAVDPPSAAVPEPGTLGIIASALAGLAWFRRRRS